MNEVIVILSEEKAIAAVIAIPQGRTAEDVFDQWIAQLATELGYEDSQDIADLKESYDYENENLVTLPNTILGLPIEKLDTIADLLDDSDCE